MQGINCVKGEIHNVLTVLRLNPPRDIPTSSSAAAASSTHSQSASHSHSSSYSHYYSSDPNYDSSLIRQLKDLYELLSLHTSLATIDTVAFLSPFLAVISTDSTDLFTTAAALHSIHKFLVYGLVSHYSAARALILTVHTLTHCRLDAGAYDRQDAEVVQMKVIEVLMECLRSASGDGLNDESVVAMIEHCMLVRRQRDASKVMRRYAENALMQMVLLLFARIGEEGAGGDRARPADVIREPRASRRKHRQSIVVRKEDSITEEDGDDTDSDSVRRLSSASPDGSDYESTSSPSHAPPRLTSTPPPLARALSSSSSSLPPPPRPPPPPPLPTASLHCNECLCCSSTSSIHPHPHPLLLARPPTTPHHPSPHINKRPMPSSASVSSAPFSRLPALAWPPTRRWLTAYRISCVSICWR